MRFAAAFAISVIFPIQRIKEQEPDPMLKPHLARGLLHFGTIHPYYHQP
jgi:hypothetical protein